MKLKTRYNTIIKEYITLFEEKQEVMFEWWIGGKIGGVAVFGDYTLDFLDVKHDIDNNIKAEMILDWFDYSMERLLADKTALNYEHYIKTEKI